MKKLLKVLGILMVGIMFIAGAGIGWFKYEQSKYAATAIPYIQTALPRIATWDRETAKSLMSPEARQKLPDAELDKVFNWFKKLGEFKTMEQPSLVYIYAGLTSHGVVNTLTYQVPVHFSAGDAMVTMQVVDDGAGFKILSFHINSPALIG